MNIVKHITVAVSLIILASCGGEKTGNTLAGKKAKLEQLKKQQEDINKQVADLQAEIIKLDPSANPEKAKLVAVKTLSTEDFQHYINLQGKIDAENIAYVTPRNQGGQVKALYVKQGDYVKKGQLLLKLDDAIYQTQLNQAHTQLKYAQDIYQRRNNLWKENIGTEVELTTAKNNVDQAQHQVDLIKEQLGYTNVYAEMSGVADEVTIKVGETFTGNPVAGGYIKLVNTSDLKATAQVPDNYLDKVKVGSTVKVILPDINDTLTSKITTAGKVIDPNSRTFQVEAKLPSNANFKPNQLALIRIMDYAANNTFTIPVNTLQTDEQGKYVLVAVTENGKTYARKKRVEAGQLYQDQLEIKSGLAAGDILITDGFQNLYDGQLITTSAS
ncbi:efflux RND transporter periplasmic adaptor subunit [Parafilimonas terrae]|uniref:RND family efflux transporter, MFP subunit n=1 Tax=Parafilimonas terrae TaxID=1465490 RepID=A0A1I5WF53_9BACT|nr:efflux RND transporter periplasmic adaptor subunit [Parafilimonas terrae]SFQ18208.1 RND family efflux transporter, MFP subunit [Parafilimonas terrae]